MLWFAQRSRIEVCHEWTRSLVEFGRISHEPMLPEAFL